MSRRFRLRLAEGVSLLARTYGSGTYGESVYGQRASDPVSLYDYRIVPVDAPALDQPLILQREHDTLSLFAVRLVSFGLPNDVNAGQVLDASTVDSAWLRFDRVSPGPPTAFNSVLDVDTDTNVFSRQLTNDDLPEPGSYRITIQLSLTSGRRYTVPRDDFSIVRVSDALRSQPMTPTAPEAYQTGIVL